jgi:hypothetical protein
MAEYTNLDLHNLEHDNPKPAVASRRRPETLLSPSEAEDDPIKELIMEERFKKKNGMINDDGSYSVRKKPKLNEFDEFMSGKKSKILKSLPSKK